MTCQEVMSENPRCCTPEDSVSQAASLMRDEDVGAIPVVDHAGGRLVGIVTDRDLAVKVIASGRDINGARVREVMSRDLVTCCVDDDYQEALDCMASRQVRRIPIVDQQGRLCGIISQADVARYSQDSELGEVVEEISSESGGGSRTRRNAPANTSLLIGAACLGIGAGLMYLMDPERGPDRRTAAKEKANRLYRSSSDMVTNAKTKLKGESTPA